MRMVENNDRGFVTIIAIAGVALVLVAGVVFVLGVAAVDEGERGVEKTQGAVTGEIYEPGWNFVIPFYQSVEYIEIRPQAYTMTGDIHDGDVNSEDAIDFRSADQQQVGVDITVRYRVADDEVDEFHRDWNTINQFEERLLRPETIDTVAREGSAFNATEANSDVGRQQIGDVVRDSLEVQAPEYVVIESVQVRDIHLDPEYERSLEQVEIASQEADAERTRAQGNADAERIRAEGDRDAYEIRNEELTQEILELEQIQAYDDGTVFVVDPETESIIMAQNRDNAEDIFEEGK